MNPERLSAPLVVFDLAGMVVNHANAVYAGISAAFGAYGFKVDREVATRALGLTCEQGVRAVLRELHPHRGFDDEQVDRICASYRKELTRFFRFSPSLAPMPGFLATVRRLRSSGTRIAVCSDLDCTTLELVMERMGWNGSELFDAIGCSEAGTSVGTKADLITHLMVQSGAKDGRNTVYVGTTPGDVAAGRQANCSKVFLVDVGLSAFRDVEMDAADAVLGFADELVHHLGAGRATPAGDD